MATGVQAWAAGIWRALAPRFVATGLFASTSSTLTPSITTRGVALEGGASLIYPTVLMPTKGVGVSAQLSPSLAAAGVGISARATRLSRVGSSLLKTASVSLSVFLYL